MLTTLLTQQGGPVPIQAIDSSDVLIRGLKRLRLQEEAVAAQLLQKRQKRYKKLKKEINWKQLLSDVLEPITTIAELDAISIGSKNTELSESALNAIKEFEKQKEAKRQQLLQLQEQFNQVLSAENKATEELLNIEIQQQIAQQKAQEFTRKRNNKIKRLKALMWLAKLDI